MFRPNDHAAREKVLAELRRITHDQRIRIRARTVQCHIGLLQVSPLAEKPFSGIFGKPTIAANLGEEGVEVFSHDHHSLSYTHYQSPVRLTTDDLISVWPAQATDSRDTKLLSRPGWTGPLKLPASRTLYHHKISKLLERGRTFRLAAAAVILNRPFKGAKSFRSINGRQCCSGRVDEG